MCDFGVIMVPQIIKTQTVLFAIYQRFQVMLKPPELTGVHYTFKHGVLHPLTEILTLFGHLR
jgi:hypothetical protein